MRWALLVSLLIAPLAAAAQVAPPSAYHAPDDFEGPVDQEGARAAVRRGDAAPFIGILRKARPHIRGEIVGQKLEQHRGVWLYEFRVIAPDGHMHYLHFGARDGQPYTPKALP